MSSMHGRINSLHRRNSSNRRKLKQKVKSETPQNIIKTTNSIQEKPVQKSIIGEYIDDFAKETKQDFSNVQDNFEKEGATPAVLDGIAGTANIGKNLIKGVQKSGDTLFEYTKTGQEGLDNVVSDGIGKTASGLLGTVGETVSTIGSLFSTQEGSTTKAVKNLGKESEKIIEGSKNFLLGAVGKGWLWGSEDKKEDIPKEKPAEKQLAEPEMIKETEPKEETDEFIQSCIDSVEKNIESETKETIINAEPEIPDETNLECSNLFNEILKNQDKTVSPKEKISDIQEALNYLKEQEPEKEQKIEKEPEKPKTDYSDITPEKIIKDTPKIAVQKDLANLLSETEPKKEKETLKEEIKSEKVEEKPKKPVKRKSLQTSIEAIRNLIEELEKQEEEAFNKKRKHSFIITR